MLKSAQRQHGQYTIPDTAVIHTRNQREFYVSSILDTHLLHSQVRIRYIDNGEFETIGYNEAKNYGAFCREVETIKIKKK